MDNALKNRSDFIGGSEANMLYLNYHTKTFKKWWEGKLTGLTQGGFTNKSMSVGTILEKDVIDLYEKIHGVKGTRDLQQSKGIARASTDYVLGNKVSDVKVTTKAFEWFLSGKVPINYKRQLMHYMYVLDMADASIIAYQADDRLLDNPFNELDASKLFEIPVIITEKELNEHKSKIEYLEHCKEMNIYPVK